MIIAAIGSATEAKLKTYGLLADKVPAAFRAEGILECLQKELRPGMRILLPRAQEARELLPQKLRELGAEVTVAPVYRTTAAQADAEALRGMLAAGEVDFVTFTSSSTVTNLLDILGDASCLQKVKTACIGPVTAETCRKHGLQPDILAKEYTIAGLVEAIRTAMK